MKKLMPLPSWFNGKDLPAMEKRLATIKAKARSIFNTNKLSELVANLYCRWMDEKEYEEFADYEAVLKKEVESRGAKFINGTKRPFGFICTIDEVHYHLTINAKGEYQWLRMAMKVK